VIGKDSSMRALPLAAVAVIAAFLLSGNAYAATPTLLGVDHDRMHPTATFAAAGADSVTVYISTQPDRATDGKFLDENSADIDFLTDGEIVTGQWMDSGLLNPGTYFVMLHAEQYTCHVDEGQVCMQGYSNVSTLTIPKPKQKFRATVDPGFLASFELTVSPLGESLPYRLCWARTGKSRKCERGTVLGTDWSDSASDSIYLTVDDLKLASRQKRVKFTWYVSGKRVASKTLRISR
jgi:hypothetical protein